MYSKKVLNFYLILHMLSAKKQVETFFPRMQVDFTS